MQLKASSLAITLSQLSKNYVKSIRNISANNRTQNKHYPNEVTIVEVGPRDGLQNEKVTNYPREFLRPLFTY